jgi:hypothetical protein
MLFNLVIKNVAYYPYLLPFFVQIKKVCWGSEGRTKIADKKIFIYLFFIKKYLVHLAVKKPYLFAEKNQIVDALIVYLPIPLD